MEQVQILNPEVKDRLMLQQKAQQTQSYMPISHKELVEYIHEKVDKRGLQVVNERYSSGKKGEQMFGEFAVKAPSNELNMAIGFRNSHDKSLPVGFVGGAQVIVCSNLMLEGDVKSVRKHTTNIHMDLDDKFDNILNEIENQFGRIEQDVALFKEMDITPQRAEELFGHILLRRQDIATPVAINSAAGFFKNPLHDFGNETVWGFYNAFTEALKGTHPKHAPKQYLNLHKFLKSEFNAN